MIGEIKEKSSGKPQPLPMMKKGPVIPTVLPSARPFPEPKSVTQQSLKKAAPIERIVHENSEDKDENTLMIENMSPEEIQAALEEVSSLLSSKNIAFLRGKGKTDLGSSSASESTKETGLISHNLHAAFASAEAEVAAIVDNEEQQPEFDNSPRFDLEGRRVIVKDNLVAEISTFLASHYDMDGSSDVFTSVSEKIASGVVAAGFCFNFTSRDDSAAMDLFNHEFSPDSPGYDVREVCEVRAVI